MYFINEHDVALGVLAKLVLSIHQQQSPLGCFLLTKPKQGQCGLTCLQEPICLCMADPQEPST